MQGYLRVYDRLQDLAEDELAESECGFWKGRSCMDMMISVWRSLRGLILNFLLAMLTSERPTCMSWCQGGLIDVTDETWNTMPSCPTPTEI